MGLNIASVSPPSVIEPERNMIEYTLQYTTEFGYYRPLLTIKSRLRHLSSKACFSATLALCGPRGFAVHESVHITLPNHLLVKIFFYRVLVVVAPQMGAEAGEGRADLSIPLPVRSARLGVDRLCGG